MRLHISTSHNTVTVKVDDHTRPADWLTTAPVFHVRDTPFLAVRDCETGARCVIALNAILVVEEYVSAPPAEPKPLPREPKPLP